MNKTEASSAAATKAEAESIDAKAADINNPATASTSNASTSIVSTSIGTPGTPLQLRKDDVVTTAFVLKTLFMLALLLVAASALLRWLSKRFPSVIPSVNKNATADAIQFIASAKTSVRTKVVLLNIDGHKAVIVETPQNSQLSWLPEGQHNNSELPKEN